MSDQLKTTPQKIRTYAGDLEVARKLREVKSVTTPVVPKETISIPNLPTVVKNSIKINPPKSRNITKDPVAKIPRIKIIEPVHTEKNNVDFVTKIPAFHELNNRTKDIRSSLPTKENIVVDSVKKTEPTPSKENIVVDSVKKIEPTPSKLNIGYDSTIITDTKRVKFKLVPSIIKSIQAWFKDLATDHKRKKIPTYSVPETSRRKGVIQKATSKSATIFTADSETIRERIRQRQSEKKSDHEPETTWSPFTETGYNLLEAQNPTKNVVVEYKKIYNPTQNIAITPEVKPVIIPETENPIIETWGTVEEGGGGELNVIEPEKSEESYVEESEEQPEEIPEQKKVVVEKQELNVKNILPTPKSAPRINYKSFFTRLEFNTVIINLFIIVTFLVATILISRVFLQKIRGEFEPTVVIPNSEIKTILNSATSIPIYVTTESINDLPNLIDSSNKISPAGVVEFSLIAPDQTELTGSYIFNLLNFRTIPNLRQSLTSTRFVSINHSAPALLLQFVDINTVRGGLLQWEAAMPLDLSELYNLPYGINSSFSDNVVNGIKVRTLTHDGKVVLIYGFLNEKVAIITNSTENFSLLSQQSVAD